MKSDSPAHQRVSVESPESSGDTLPEARTEDEAWTEDAKAAHSRENIAQWSSYLPDDCVRTMIEMGWDITT
jgi:hypothetical protein